MRASLASAGLGLAMLGLAASVFAVGLHAQTSNAPKSVVFRAEC